MQKKMLGTGIIQHESSMSERNIFLSVKGIPQGNENRPFHASVFLSPSLPFPHSTDISPSSTPSHDPYFSLTALSPVNMLSKKSTNAQ